MITDLPDLMTEQHRKRVLVENYEFLRESGCSHGQAASRLGVKPESLEKLLRRRGILTPRSA